MSNLAKIQWLGKPINTEIALPSSKSISNRLLVMKHLSAGKICIKNLSNADDTRLMTALLNKVSKKLNNAEVDERCSIDCGNAGTVFRFLTAVLAISQGNWFLTGSDRMKERPVEPLVNSLKELGANIEYAEKPGYPPLNIEGRNIHGGSVQVDASMSSQFLSALLLIGSAMKQGLTISAKGDIVSLPYAEMTADLLRQAGVRIATCNGTYTIDPGSLNPARFFVEPDWSSASYWFEIASLVPGSRTLFKGLKRKSLQGDRVMVDIFEMLGLGSSDLVDGILIKSGIKEPVDLNYDFSHCPDLVPAVAATCAALNIPARFSGLAHLRIKESDRIHALVYELKKINNSISVRNEDVIVIGKRRGQIPAQTVAFNTYGDHRLAMALAPMAVLCENVLIQNPEVVNKSYPGFWTDLSDAGFMVSMQ